MTSQISNFMGCWEIKKKKTERLKNGTWLTLNMKTLNRLHCIIYMWHAICVSKNKNKWLVSPVALLGKQSSILILKHLKMNSFKCISHFLTGNKFKVLIYCWSVRAAENLLIRLNIYQCDCLYKWWYFLLSYFFTNSEDWFSNHLYCFSTFCRFSTACLYPFTLFFCLSNNFYSILSHHLQQLSVFHWLCEDCFWITLILFLSFTDFLQLA